MLTAVLSFVVTCTGAHGKIARDEEAKIDQHRNNLEKRSERICSVEKFSIELIRITDV